MATIERIKGAIKVSDILGQRLALTRAGAEFKALCPWHEDHRPSLTIVDAKGIYKCFSCGEQGDVIDAAQWLYGVDRKGAIAKLREQLGDVPAPAPAATKAQRAIDHARKLWEQATLPGADSAPRWYLERRKLRFESLPADLRMLAAHDYYAADPARPGKQKSIGKFPVLVAAVRDLAGEVVAIHRVYVDQDGVRLDKAGVLDKGDAKKALGSTSGHAVRLTPDAPVLVLCEGVETALAVLKALLATGAVPAGEIAVWATLGTSGLAHVAIPAWAAEIIVMGDHDPERTRANGERYRPGHAAVARLRERAEITQPIKAAYPEIEGQDWADVLAAEGEAPIRAALTAAMSAPVVKEPKPAKAAVVVPSPEATGRLDYVVKSSNGMRYYGPLPLGSDEKRLLFWNRRRQTTYDIARPRCHLQAELEGGCDHEWFLRLPDLFVVRDETGAKVLWHNIGHYLKRLCDDLGPFNEDRLRGLGATLDGKRLVFRLGDRLLVDGRLTDLDDYNFSDGPQPGRMIFPRVHNLPFEATEVADDGRITGATDEQAQLVRRTFGELKWRYPQHATFVAGWCMIAAVCGALPWRPHVHLGGESAVGKSWAQDYLIGRAVPIALKPMLSSTRAGIAQAVGIDARPVLYDEAETETERARQQMQEIMLMARGASTGYGERVELKGTTHGQARRSMTRSMYLISAINLPTMQLADESRWVLVELLKQGGSPAEAERDQRRFRRCQELLDQWPSNIGDLLTARAIRHFDTLIANYTLLREVVRRKLSARLGDTYGMLLAGDQLMQHTRVLTEAEARAVVNSLRWEDAEDASSDSDAIRFLRHISGYRMRITSDAGNHSSTQEVTIYELVDLLVKRGESNLLGVSIVDAERVLGAYGLRVADSVLTSDKKRPGNMLWFANDPGVNWKKLIAGTQWAGSHKAPLRALAAVPSNGSIGFNGGLRATRARGIPVDIFLGEDDAVNAGRPDEPIASTAAEEEDIPY